MSKFLVRAIRRIVFSSIIALLLCWQTARAATSPVSDQLKQLGTPIYGNLDLANHVFGYRFRVREPGQIEQLGGYFPGTKEVVVINDSNTIVASAHINGNATAMQYLQRWASWEVRNGNSTLATR